MNWHDLSEVNFGLVLEGRVPASAYRSDYFDVPYDTGIEVLMRRGATKEDVAKVLDDPQLISDAHDAVCKWNGISEKENFDWGKALIEAKTRHDIAKKLEKASRRMKDNEEYDLLPLFGDLQSIVAGKSSGLSVANEIDYTHYKPFIKSGNPTIDRILGGIPADGPIIVYGVTGVGKSHWLASAMDYYLHQYPDKKAAIYTLEMSAEHYLWRETNMYPSLKDVLDRLYVSGSVHNIEELVAEISALDVDIVGLDDMDNMVKNSEASEYENVYRRVKEVCRFLEIPFYVLGQPNREAKHAVERGDKFLGRYDIAWSGAAENSAALQIALQRANSLDMNSDMFPTSDETLFYEIFWKSRDGWPSDYNEKGQEGPGAIVTTKGKQAWRGNVYANKYKLWSPASGSRSIGKKKPPKD